MFIIFTLKIGGLLYTEDDAIFEQSDSSDDNDEELADKESEEEFNDFYD